MISGSAFFFMSCDDDDDNKFIPESAVTQAFDIKYPDASRVHWENESGYSKADFHTEGYEAEAWFDRQGNWLLTETDLTYDRLPAAIRSSFESSEYANWRVDDVDKIERPDTETIYVLDIERGEAEMNLHYSEDGYLINERTDGSQDEIHRPSTTPNTIKELIQEMYPGATLFEIDKEYNGTEVDILHERIHKEVWLDTDNQWVLTRWEIRSSSLPDVVMSAFRSSEYASYRIDDLHVVERPDGIFYEFELEWRDRDLTILFGEDGTLVSPAY